MAEFRPLSRLAARTCFALAFALLAPGATPAPAQDVQSDEGGDRLIGGPGVGPGQFADLRDIAFGGTGDLYVLEGATPAAAGPSAHAARVQQFGRDGTLKASIDLSDAATGRTLDAANGPRRIAVDPAGDVYVTQPNANLVMQFAPDGKLAHATGIADAFGVTPYQRPGFTGVAVIASIGESAGDATAGRQADRITLLASDGRAAGEIVLARPVRGAQDLTADRDGNLYVQAEPNAIYVFSPTGALVRTLGGNATAHAPDGSEVLHTVAVDSRKNVYTMTWGNPGLVTRFDADGRSVVQREGQFKWADPWSSQSAYTPLAIDADDRLWVACTRLLPPDHAQYKVLHASPVVIRTNADFFMTPGAVRARPVYTLGFTAALQTTLPFNVSYASGRPVGVRFVVPPASRGVTRVAVDWHAYDAEKAEVGAGRFDLPLKDGEPAAAAFEFTPRSYGAYFVMAKIAAPQGPLEAVGLHVGVTPAFPAMPALTTEDGLGGWADPVRQLWTGLPLMRLHPGLDEAGLRTTDQEVERAERAGMTVFLQLTDNAANLNAERIGAIARRYKGRVRYYEVCNEPNFTSTPDRYFALHQAAYRAIKQADPQAMVLGPATVNVDLAWIGRLYDMGLKDVTDVLSVHDYEGHESITPEHWRWKFAQLRRIMAAHGDGDKPVWQTERAIAGVRAGSFQGRVQAIRTTLHRDLLETLGVPAEHDHYYYLNENGYAQVPSYLWSRNGPHPAALALRTRYALTTAIHRAFARPLDFGATGNAFLLGLRFDGDGGGTVCLRTLGTPQADVRFAVASKSPVGHLDVFDAWGNPDTVPVHDGQAIITLDELPKYVMLPPGVTLTPQPIDFGDPIRDGLHWAYSAKVLGPDFDRLTNGVVETYQSGDPHGDTDGANLWTGELPTGKDGVIVPQTLTARFDRPQRIGRVVVRGVRADNTFCALLRYDLEYFDGTAWRLLDRVRHNIPASETVRTADAEFATWMDDTCTYVSRFEPVTAIGVRLVVRDVSRGYLPDTRAKAPVGVIEPKLMLGEVSIFRQPDDRTPAAR